MLEARGDLNDATSWQPSGIVGTEDGGTFTFDDVPTDQDQRYFQVSEGNPQN